MDHVNLARFQAGEARLQFRPHQASQPPVVGYVRDPHWVIDWVVVIVEALENEVLVVRVADETEGTRAHWLLVQREIAAAFGVRLRVDRHLAGAVHVHGQEAGVRRRQLDRPGAVVGRFIADPVERASGRVGRHPAAGVIRGFAALVIFGQAAHPVVAENHVPGDQG